jgi:hypothetical protein
MPPLPTDQQQEHSRRRFLGQSNETYCDQYFALIESAPSEPATTQCDDVYVESQSTDPVLALVGPRLEEPFDPQIPHEIIEGVDGSCPSATFKTRVPQNPHHVGSAKGVLQDSFDNTEDETARTPSVVYQYYFKEAYGKVIPLRRQSSVRSRRHENNRERNSSRAALAPLSPGNSQRDLHSTKPMSSPRSRIEHGFTVVAPVTRVSVMTKKPTRPLHARSLKHKETKVCISPQTAPLDFKDHPLPELPLSLSNSPAPSLLWRADSSSTQSHDSRVYMGEESSQHKAPVPQSNGYLNYCPHFPRANSLNLRNTLATLSSPAPKRIAHGLSPHTPPSAAYI